MGARPWRSRASRSRGIRSRSCTSKPRSPRRKARALGSWSNVASLVARDAAAVDVGVGGGGRGLARLAETALCGPSVVRLVGQPHGLAVVVRLREQAVSDRAQKADDTEDGRARWRGDVIL